eukprot:TRINITY_DN6230_c0_g1_i10.p1 TRINITY_DN6230_c0_g1~~TRINITY_DN6230_c0_g1_i10.p1  ORF type:complete len:652 (+),score=58.84 TRINITY_DN6230_c0_g1_i10:95-1957(+)
MKKIWNMSHKKCHNKEKALALHIETSKGIVPLPKADKELMEYYGNMFFKKEEPLGFEHKPMKVPEVDPWQLDRNKAVSWDLIPDSVLKCKWNKQGDEVYKYPDIIEKVKKFLKEVKCLNKNWKQARLILLSKTGKSTVSLKETRPIAVLPWMYRLIEMSKKDKLEKDIWPTITMVQRGFRPGCNTHTNIIDLKNWMTKRIEAKRPSVILYVDIKKAYDHVIRRILLEKLSRIVTDEEALDIYRCLLSNTSLRIGETVMETNVGVPQGAILSPLMFNVYINECLESLEKTIKTGDDNDGIVLAYADNILVGGDPERIKEWESLVNQWEKWNLYVEWHKCFLCKYRTRVKSKAPKVKSFRYLGVQIGWIQKSPKNQLINWVRGLKGNWYAKPLKMARLTGLWFDYSHLLYKFYADFVREKLTMEEINLASIRMARKRMRVPSNVPNEVIYQLLHVNIGETMWIRAYNEKFKQEEPEHVQWKLNKKYWYEILKDVSISQLAAIHRDTSYGRRCNICKKWYTKSTCMLYDKEYEIWAKWFSGKTLLEACQELEKNKIEVTKDILVKGMKLLTPNPKSHAVIDGLTSKLVPKGIIDAWKVRTVGQATESSVGIRYVLGQLTREKK